jgi:hypothetical protein
MNILDELLQQVQQLHKKVDVLQDQIVNKPTRLTFTEYCRREGITRPTGYKRAELGLIELEKIGGRQYVVADTIQNVKKYQRQ